MVEILYLFKKVTMKRKVRLTESQMVDLIKKVLKEQTTFGFKPTDFNRQEKINDAWCSVNYGVVENQRPLKVMWCGKGGYKEKMAITDAEMNIASDKCSKFSTPILDNSKEGFFKVYDYYKLKKNGSNLLISLNQQPCGDFYMFQGENKDGSITFFYNTGGIDHYPNPNSQRYNLGTWEWDGSKPVFKLPLTKKAVGYAETEEDITDNNKILYTGSNNDLVKRVQYEILRQSKGKINSGCKKDENGKYKPSLCDGIFGPKTKSAVQNFQKTERLKDKSGIVGAETWDSLTPYSIEYEGDTQEELENS